MFRDHHGQAAIGDQLGVDSLAHVPDLGQGHLKADGGGGQLPVPQHIHGGGIVDVQAEVAVDSHACFSCRDQQAQIADQHIPDAQFIQHGHIVLDLGQLAVVDDPGQHGSHTASAGQGLQQLAVLHQDMDGNIEHGGFGVHQLGGQLLPGGDLDGQTGDALGSLEVGDGGALADGMVFPAGPEGSQLIQHITAHGIDGSSGDGEAGIHMGADFHTPVGGAAGLGDALGKGLAGQRHTAGQFRNGTGDGAGAAFGVGGGQGTAVHGYNAPEGQVYQLGLAGFVGITGSLEPLGIFLGVLPDAEHFAVDATGIVAVGKALTVECGHQGIHHAGGNIGLVQRLAVDGGDGCHVFRLLHAAFQLDGGNAHFFQLLQVMHQAVVLQAQGVLAFPVVITVALTAGLSTAAPVAGAAADHGRHIALAAVAHAQCAMGKDFDFDGGMGTDVADLLPAQFTAQDHPLQAHGSAQLHAGQTVNSHLGRAVDGDVRSDLAAQLHHTQVLDNEGVHAAGSRMADHFRHLGDFLVGDQGI